MTHTAVFVLLPLAQVLLCILSVSSYIPISRINIIPRIYRLVSDSKSTDVITAIADSNIPNIQFADDVIGNKYLYIGILVIQTINIMDMCIMCIIYTYFIHVEYVSYW